MGISWYQEKGLANQINTSTVKISVASFHRLNKTSPLIRAAKVGLRNVKGPIEVDGFMKGPTQPKRKPAMQPFKGPSKGAVKPLSSTLDRVIDTLVPGRG
jgi:hypothetical protein